MMIRLDALKAPISTRLLLSIQMTCNKVLSMTVLNFATNAFFDEHKKHCKAIKS
jgi:hypothetical protein